VTLIFANHLYGARDRCEQHADIAVNYFEFLSELLNEISLHQPELINGYQRLKEMMQWLEERVSNKEANDVLLKGHLDMCVIFVKSVTAEELNSISTGLIRLMNDIIFPASPNERKAARMARDSGSDNGTAVSTRVTTSGDSLPVSPRKLGSPLCDTQG
jgi:hypothetical protein